LATQIEKHRNAELTTRDSIRDIKRPVKWWWRCRWVETLTVTVYYTTHFRTCSCWMRRTSASCGSAKQLRRMRRRTDSATRTWVVVHT